MRTTCFHCNATRRDCTCSEDLRDAILSIAVACCVHRARIVDGEAIIINEGRPEPWGEYDDGDGFLAYLRCPDCDARLYPGDESHPCGGYAKNAVLRAAEEDNVCPDCETEQRRSSATAAFHEKMARAFDSVGKTADAVSARRAGASLRRRAVQS